MVERYTIVKEEFRYNGIANFKDFYEYAHGWLKDEDYVIHEEKYEEKHSGDSKELRIKWVCNKKVTDYFRIALELRWQVLNMTDIEVETNGKKEKMNRFSELKITVKGMLEKDYNSKWGASGFQKFLREVYDKYVIPSRTEELEIKVQEVVQEFREEMKAYLNLSARR